MKYTLEERESCLILTIEGSISDDYLREVRNAFDHAISGEKDLIVDLSEVTFISSSGLGLLFNSNTRLKTKGLRIVLSGATDDIRRLFNVTRMDNHIALSETFEEALQILGQS